MPYYPYCIMQFIAVWSVCGFQW